MLLGCTMFHDIHAIGNSQGLSPQISHFRETLIDPKDPEAFNSMMVAGGS